LTARAPSLSLALTDYVRALVDGPVHWGDGAYVTLTFRYSPGQRAAIRESARERAFGPDTLGSVREQFAASGEGKRLSKIRPELKAAERALAEAQRQIRHCDLDRESALENLSGEALTRRLGELAKETEACRERLAASEAGLTQLRNEVASLEATIRGNVNSWISEAVWRRRQDAMRRATEARARLAVPALAEALGELEMAEAEVRALENSYLVEAHARPLAEALGVGPASEA
jgi:chromosome segregation ATPase